MPACSSRHLAETPLKLFAWIFGLASPNAAGKLPAAAGWQPALPRINNHPSAFGLVVPILREPRRRHGRNGEAGGGVMRGVVKEREPRADRILEVDNV